MRGVSAGSGGGLGLGDKVWAQRIAARIESGEAFPVYVVDMVSAVLGRRVLRGGRHTVRPDAKDRQAGDYRDEYVSI